MLVEIEGEVLNTDQFHRISGISGQSPAKTLYTKFNFSIDFLSQKAIFQLKGISGEEIAKEQNVTNIYGLLDSEKTEYINKAFQRISQQRDELIKCWKGLRDFKII